MDNWREARPEVDALPSRERMGTSEPAQRVGKDMDWRKESSDELLPEVRAFIVDLWTATLKSDINELRYLYYRGWNSITSTYFENAEWPSVEKVSVIVKGDVTFLLLYKELSFRHIFVNGSPTLVHRIESWANYQQLFEVCCSQSVPKLPLEWMYDAMDEFLYQFQDYTSYRHKLCDLTADEIEVLKETATVWAYDSVVECLERFVEKSAITLKLEEGRIKANEPLAPLDAWGLVALLGSVRLHCLSGEFATALRRLDSLDIDDRGAVFTRIRSAHLSLFYHIGLAYMMEKRYVDAINVFSRVLTTLRNASSRRRWKRTPNSQDQDSSSVVSKSFSDNQLSSLYEKTLALCALSNGLCAGKRVEDAVRRLVNEAYGDRMSDAKQYGEVFAYACPKFVNISSVDWESIDATTYDESLAGAEKIKKKFAENVSASLELPTLRSYLKMYKSIPLEKLKNFVSNSMSLEDFEGALERLRENSFQLVRRKESSKVSEGERMYVNDVEFEITPEKMVVVVDASDASKDDGRHAAKFFADHLVKLDATLRGI